MLPHYHPLQVTASGFFNVTVDVHRDKRGTAYRQWQRSVDVAEAMLYDVEMVSLTAPYSPAHHLTPPCSPATLTLTAPCSLVITTYRRRASREYRLSSARSPEAPS